MTDQELDKWFCHLTVAKKEEAMEFRYPECSSLWNALSHNAKCTIYDRMGGRDAHDHHKWKKGNTSLT